MKQNARRANNRRQNDNSKLIMIQWLLIWGRVFIRWICTKIYFGFGFGLAWCLVVLCVSYVTNCKSDGNIRLVKSMRQLVKDEQCERCVWDIRGETGNKRRRKQSEMEIFDFLFAWHRIRIRVNNLFAIRRRQIRNFVCKYNITQRRSEAVFVVFVVCVRKCQSYLGNSENAMLIAHTYGSCSQKADVCRYNWRPNRAKVIHFHWESSRT